MMKAIAIAFSTYSKIPMPHFKWDPKALQYSMCAFPLVGAVILGLRPVEIAAPA